MNEKHPAFSIRPTQQERRKQQLEDLKKPGWVVITKDGKLTPPTQEEKAKCPK